MGRTCRLQLVTRWEEDNYVHLLTCSHTHATHTYECLYSLWCSVHRPKSLATGTLYFLIFPATGTVPVVSFLLLIQHSCLHMTTPSTRHAPPSCACLHVSRQFRYTFFRLCVESPVECGANCGFCLPQDERPSVLITSLHLPYQRPEKIRLST